MGVREGLQRRFGFFGALEVPQQSHGLLRGSGLGFRV